MVDIGIGNNLLLGNMKNIMNSDMGGNGFSVPGMGDMGDFTKVASLDDFTAGLDDSENSLMLKGAISKIQSGQTVNPADLSGMSGDNAQLVQDLQDLMDKPGGTQKITRLEGFSNTKNVADKFSEMLSNYVDNVDKQNKNAESAVETFASGGDIDLHSVMIASEKANVSMQLAMQLSNKILAAYKEINNVRV
jgi:flagellar hook-basal body complex protein FliE